MEEARLAAGGQRSRPEPGNPCRAEPGEKVNVFFDTSALAKRYVEEKGSDEVERLCGEASELAVSVVTIPEIISALSRLKRESRLTARQYNRAKEAMWRDLGDVSVCQLTPEVIDRAIQVLENHPVQAMDALHVACAIEWKSELFVSSDSRQLAAAKNLKLETQRV